MDTIEKINQQTRDLPEDYQTEVLDFVEYLANKVRVKRRINPGVEDQDWLHFSLSQALKGLEDEDIPIYFESDLIEKWQ